MFLSYIPQSVAQVQPPPPVLTFHAPTTSSGGQFLHRIGISIIHATLCFVLEMQTITQTSASPRFVFSLNFLYKTNSGIYYMHVHAKNVYWAIFKKSFHCKLKNHILSYSRPNINTSDKVNSSISGPCCTSSARSPAVKMSNK